MEKKELLKMNLQHFAEPTQESPKDEPKPPAQEAPKDHLSDNPGSGSDEPQPSLEEQMQQLRIENAKLKKAQEDAATDASNWKKKYNATLSDAEKLAQEKDVSLNQLVIQCCQYALDHLDRSEQPPHN